MEVNRQVVTLLLTVTIVVAPLQGTMANETEMSDVHAGHAEQSALPDASPSCSHHDHHPDSGAADTNPDSAGNQVGQSVSSKPGCNCSANCNCSCCSKVSTPVLPSVYSTIWVSTQTTERIQTFFLFTGTFVLVRTRPPTFGHSA